MKILALDDQRTVLEAVKILLQMHGHHVDCYCDAVKAAEAVRGNRYDVLFFDYQMPDHDGLWFLENIRIPEGTKAVLMTAHARESLVRRALALGAWDYMLKPFKASELLSHLNGSPRRVDVCDPRLLA